MCVIPHQVDAFYLLSGKYVTWFPNKGPEFRISGTESSVGIIDRTRLSFNIHITQVEDNSGGSKGRLSLLPPVQNIFPSAKDSVAYTVMRD